MKIKKSPNDNRDYVFEKLKNGCEIMAIYSPTVSFSIASLLVQVGTYNDPDNYEGLAHFLEHMIFMGTEKYPNRNHFFDYIAKHGGTFNASTGPDFTLYYFTIKNEKFEKALDIWSEFFKTPIFDKTTIGKEMKAVNEEHLKNIQNDGWRIMSLLRNIASNSHPFKKFSTGNYETLKKPDIRKRLKTFFNTFYSSNIMKVCLLTNIGNKKIQSELFNKFDGIQNLNITSKKNNDKIFDLKSDVIIKYETSSNVYILTIIWEFDHKIIKSNEKLVNYFIYLLNHRGSGTLGYVFQKSDFIVSFGATIFDDSHNIISMDVQLTKEGIKYKKMVISAIYYYLLLISKNIDKTFFEELQITNDNLFNHGYKIRNSSSFVTNIVHNLRKTTSDIIYADYDLGKYDEKIIKKIATELCTSKIIVCIGRPNSENRFYECRDKHYGTEYDIIYKDIDKFPNDKLLKLPQKNPFVKKIKKTNDTFDKSMATKKYGEITLWKFPNLHNNNLFSHIQISFQYPSFMSEYFDKIGSKIYRNSFMSELGSHLFYRGVSNEDMIISIIGDYVHFYFYGNLQHIMEEIQHIFEKFFETVPKKKYFDKEKKIKIEKILQQLKYLDPLSVLGGIELKNKLIIDKYNVSYENQLEIVKNTKYEDMKKIQNKLRNPGSVKIIIVGDLTNEQINKCLKVTSKYVNIHKLKLSEDKYKIIKETKLKKNIYYCKSKNKNKKGYYTNVFYELGYYDGPRCYARLIKMVLGDKFFDQLRSDEQLGYIVGIKIDHLGYPYLPLAGLSFYVQSSTATNEELQKRIIKFVKDGVLNIEKLTDSQLENYKHSIIESITEKNENTTNDFVEYSNNILCIDENFETRYRLASIIKKITKKELVNYYKTYLAGGKNMKRHVVNVF